jgi:hypothetical protein
METKMVPSINIGVATTAIGMAIVFFLTLAMISMTTPTAKATPQIANGKPCNTCHEGTPPNKGNVKK